MSDKDPTQTAFLIEWIQQVSPYVSTLFLSAWGGIVNHVHGLKNSKRKFNLKDFAFDLIVATFAGLLTHFLCELANIEGAMASVLVAISGHMGTRAIAGYENLHKRIFGVKGE